MLLAPSFRCGPKATSQAAKVASVLFATEANLADAAGIAAPAALLHNLRQFLSASQARLKPATDHT